MKKCWTQRPSESFAEPNTARLPLNWQVNQPGTHQLVGSGERIKLRPNLEQYSKMHCVGTRIRHLICFITILIGLCGLHN
jgi:hypothetical protein